MSNEEVAIHFVDHMPSAYACLRALSFPRGCRGTAILAMFPRGLGILSCAAYCPPKHHSPMHRSAPHRTPQPVALLHCSRTDLLLSI